MLGQGHLQVRTLQPTEVCQMTAAIIIALLIDYVWIEE
jgi:hypothetical protein